MDNNPILADQVMTQNAGLGLIFDQIFKLMKAVGLNLDMRHNRILRLVPWARVINNLCIPHANTPDVMRPPVDAFLFISAGFTDTK